MILFISALAERLMQASQNVIGQGKVRLLANAYCMPPNRWQVIPAKQDEDTDDL